MTRVSHLRGDLPDDYGTLTFHQRSDTQPIIARGSSAMAALPEAEAKR
jgi:hypothetical protein